MSSTMARDMARKVLEDQRVRLKLDPGDDTETYWKGRVDAGLDLLKLVPGGWETLLDEMAWNMPPKTDDIPA